MLARFLSLVVLLSCPAQTPAFLAGVAPATRNSARSSVFRQQRQARALVLAWPTLSLCLERGATRTQRVLRTRGSGHMPR